MRTTLVLLLTLLTFPLYAWGPHSEITQAALDALGPSDPLFTQLGDAVKKLPQYCWMADQRQSLIIRPDETFYPDDYLLFPPLPRHTDHLCPDVKRTYSPHFRRALQALRTEDPINAARWIGSLLHFVEDTGSPPHAAEIRGDVHSKMENWVNAKLIHVPGYAPQLLGDTDEAAEAGFLQRMDGLIEFSKARALRCRADVELGNRAAVEPVVLESALEVSRVVADLLHTLAVRAASGSSSPGELTVTIPNHATPAERLAPLRAKLVLLDTTYSTLADSAGTLHLRHLPPGTYRAACLLPGHTSEIRTVTIANGPASIDVPLSGSSAGVVRNPTFGVSWVSHDAPDDWYRATGKDKSANGWQGEWLPLEKGKSYRLVMKWKANVDADAEVVARFKPTLNPTLPATISAPITPQVSEFRITATQEKGTWAQIFIRSTKSPATVLDSIDLLPAE